MSLRQKLIRSREQLAEFKSNKLLLSLYILDMMVMFGIGVYLGGAL